MNRRGGRDYDDRGGRGGGGSSNLMRRNDRNGGRVEKRFDKQERNGENLRPVRWDQVKLEPFKKDFFNPASSVLERSRSEVCQFLDKNEITMIGLIDDCFRWNSTFPGCTEACWAFLLVSALSPAGTNKKGISNSFHPKYDPKIDGGQFLR